MNVAALIILLRHFEECGKIEGKHLNVIELRACLFILDQHDFGFS